MHWFENAGGTLPDAARTVRPVLRPLVLLVLIAQLCACSVIDPRPSEQYIVYPMHRGDTIGQVARAFQVTPEELLELNNISDPRKIQIGFNVKVPYHGQPLGRSHYEGRLAAVGAVDSTPARSTATAHAGIREIKGGNIGGAITKPIPMSDKNDKAPRIELGGASHYLGRLQWPVTGAPLSSSFGYRWFTFHEGLDLQAPTGAPVRAAHAGVVAYSGSGISGYGNIVVLRGDGLVTVYAHHSRNRVHQGERVAKGEVIAEVGATGHATGPHLHFETRVKGQDGRNVAVDPLVFYP